MAERWTDANPFHAFFPENHFHDMLKLPNSLLLKKENPEAMQAPVVCSDDSFSWWL